MRPVAIDVVRNVVCLSVLVSVMLGTQVSCAKTAEPIETPFGEGTDSVGPRNDVLDGGRDPMGRGSFWGCPVH